MDLSIGMPGIRPGNWKRLYDSIDFNGKWELIIVSPYDLPEELKYLTNVIHIKDFGNPIRTQQITLAEARGKFYTFAADDSVFGPDAINTAFNLIDKDDYKSVVMGKYTESESAASKKFMMSDEYYILHTHRDCRFDTIPKHYKLWNAGMVHKELLVKLGGWDCNFEVGGMCFVDLAIRMQNHGAKFITQEQVYLICGHMPGRTGDHGPICDAQEQHDMPLFTSIYSKQDSVHREVVDIDLWKNVPNCWERRFRNNEKL